jgi:soluble lytic murein transglycosylase-like protein
MSDQVRTKHIPLTNALLIMVIIVVICAVSAIKINKIGLEKQYSEMQNECEELMKETEAAASETEKADKVEKLTRIARDLQPKLDYETAQRIVSTVITEAEKKQLDPILVIALIFEESAFDVMANSKKDALGLMQVHYKSWMDSDILSGNGIDSPYKLFWIEENIKCGTEILRLYYEESDYNIVKALHRYHTGDTDLPRGKKYYEIDYVSRILIRAYEISGRLNPINVSND